MKCFAKNLNISFVETKFKKTQRKFEKKKLSGVRNKMSSIYLGLIILSEIKLSEKFNSTVKEITDYIEIHKDQIICK